MNKEYLFLIQAPNIDNPYEFNSAPKWKKCHSQFTDVDDYRRHGNNKWHNETGCYVNKALRAVAIPKTDTIPPRLL